MAEKKDVKVSKKAESTVAGYIMRDGRFYWKKKLEERYKTLNETIVQSSSRQMDLEEWKYDIDNCYRPLYDPVQLAACLSYSTYHNRAVEVKAGDVASGYKIKPKEQNPETTPDEKQREKADKFFSECGADRTFLEILDAAIKDYEAVGYGGLEIGRSLTGEITRLWHLPAPSLRIGKDHRFVLQKISPRKRYFQFFPKKCEITQTSNGNIEAEWNLMDPGTGALVSQNDKDSKKISPLDAANEVILFINYNSASPYYGMPSIVPALGAVAGNIYARDFNLDSFAESMIPAYVVLVTGASLPPDVKTLIESYFEEIKGKARSTLVLTAKGQNAKIEFKKLEVDIPDISFKEYKLSNRDEILLADGMHPARVGIIETAQLGAGSGLSQLVHYKTSVIEPKQTRIEHKLNMLLEKGLLVMDWVFKFIDLDVRDQKQQSEVLTAYVTAEILSVDEARAELGRGPKEVPKEPEKEEEGLEWKTSDLKSLEDFKQSAALGLDKVGMMREAFTENLRAVWDKRPFRSTDMSDVKGFREKLRNDLVGAAALIYPTVLADSAQTLSRTYEVTYEDDEMKALMAENFAMFQDYIDTAWLEDFEMGALGLEGFLTEEDFIEGRDKVKKQMASRAGLYGGLALALWGSVLLLTSRKTKRRVYWVTRSARPCPDCVRLASESPYSPVELLIRPGSGHTQCRGNCRCYIRLE